MAEKVIIGVAVVAVFALIWGVLSMWRKVPQDKALVVTGWKKRVISGSGGIVIPVVERADVLSLENMTIKVDTRGALTENGVPINVDAVTVIKVKSDNESIYTAVEQFNTGKEKETIDRIKDTAKDVLEGKLREIISKMTVEDAYRDRDKFSSQIQEVAVEALELMGLELKAFTIKDIGDDNGYLKSIGKKRIAEVKRDAEISEAEAISETNIKKAEAMRNSTVNTARAKKEGKKAEIEAETEIAESEKEKELKVQSYNKEKEIAKAQADLAYSIQENITKKEVVDTEMEVNLIERRKQTELAEEEAKRREKELEATINKQADADRYKREKEADAKKYERVKQAQADAEAIKAKGLAEAESITAVGRANAEAIKAKGLAEAEAMKKKAEAFEQYNDAAVLQMFIGILPEIADNIAKPLSKTEKIVIVDNGDNGNGGASKVAGYVGNIMSQVPEIVKATTGVDLMEMLKNKKNGKDLTNSTEMKELLAKELFANKAVDEVVNEDHIDKEL